MSNYVFSIEGNVGSGKSYLIKNLMKCLKTIYPVSLSKSVFKKRRIPT